MTDRPNVLLIIMDCVRAKNMGVYGHYNDNTPFLSKFFNSRGAIYTQARSPGIWTVPSHVSMFTGLDVAEHGIVSREDSLKKGATVWDVLGDRWGYSTGVFSPNLFLTDIPIGISSSFDKVCSRMDGTIFPNNLTPEEVDTHNSDSLIRYIKKSKDEYFFKPLANAGYYKLKKLAKGNEFLLRLLGFHRVFETSEIYSKKFLEWLEDVKGPWAACINFTDAHVPYAPIDEYDVWGESALNQIQASLDNFVWDFNSGKENWWKLKALESLYDGSILQMDNNIEKIFRELEKNGALEETLVVITSDHGEGFGELSATRDVRIAGHDYGISEEQLHIPLLVKHPHQSTSKVFDELTSTKYFYKTVLDTLNEGETRFFPTTSKIISSSYERSDVVKIAEGYDINFEKFAGDAHAVYVSEAEGGIKKYVKWGNDYSVTTSVGGRGLHRTADDESSAEKMVSSYLNELEDRDVSERSEKVSREAVERLRDLGYA